MKHDVVVATTLDVILANKTEWESTFEIPVKQKDIEAIFFYMSKVEFVPGLTEFLFQISNHVGVDAYITFNVEYDVAFNAYYFGVLFDGNDVGLGIIIMDNSDIVVIDSRGGK